MTTPALIPTPTVALSTVLGGPVHDRTGAEVGKLRDVVLTLPGWGYPVVSGVVVSGVVGGRDGGTVVGAEHLTAITGDGLTLSTAPTTPGGGEVGYGQVLLQANVLGHRVLDLACARWLRGRDAVLTQAGHQWLVVGVDVAQSGWWQRLTHHPESDIRDWAAVEVLLGHTPTAGHRMPWTRLGELRAAQLADLLETATRAEKLDLLTHLGTDPAREAHVIAEITPDHRSRLLATRSTPDIAAVLARMNDDDATDTLMYLPQPRRRPVLDALPAPRRATVLTLLGFAESTAGGLMSTHHTTASPAATAADTLRAVRTTSSHHQALTSVYVCDRNTHLVGVTTLLSLLQAHPNTPLSHLAELDPTRVGPDTEPAQLARIMADNHLVALPVVDDTDHLLGVVTVDDVLDAVLPAVLPDDLWPSPQGGLITSAPTVPARSPNTAPTVTPPD